jgi:hypothetical protein
MRRLLASLLRGGGADAAATATATATHTAAAAAAAVIAPARRAHRPFSSLDADAIRPVGGGGRCAASHNPGIRVTLDAVASREEEAALLAELRALQASHGFASSAPQSARAGGAPAGTVAPLRVTGRPELLPAQRLAPWGYGDAFDLAAVPPALAALVRRVRSGATGGLALGRARDITINYRSGGHFKLDAHVDPAEDGENVCVIGLLSDTVLTFVPPEALPRAPAAAGGDSGSKGTMLPQNQKALLPPRRSAEEVCRRSWSDGDLDALLKRRAMVHFCGDARWRWGHAIRAGVMAPAAPAAQAGTQQQQQQEGVICDWWGSLGVLLRRGPERVSIVLAFADANANANANANESDAAAEREG